MSFTHMGAGLASPDASSSQLYRRGVLIHCPPEYSVDIVPPIKEGSSWHYGLRVKPLPGLGSSPSGPSVDAKGKRIKTYEIHRKWEDCLDLQRVLEKEYAAVSKARKSGAAKKGNSVYGHPQRAASFDSLPTGPDLKTIPTDIHAFLPKLAAKSSLFRGASGSALVQQRSEEFNEFISALFAPDSPVLVDQARQAPAVREWFGFWRRDRDAMRRRDCDRASIAPSGRRLSIAASEMPPLPIARPASPSPISPENQHDPRPSYETTYGDLASALDTFPMPPTPLDSPPVMAEAKTAQPSSGGFVPIVQRRLGMMRGDGAGRNHTFRNALFFNSAPKAVPSVPGPEVAPSDEGEYESDVRQYDTVRGPRPAVRTEGDELGLRPHRAPTPSMSSASTTLTHQTPASASPRSSQTSDWSMGFSAGIVQALAGVRDRDRSERETPVPVQDEQSEIEYMRKMSLSSLSSTSSRRPPPIPPRSNLRRSLSSSASYRNRALGNNNSSSNNKPMPSSPGEMEIPTVVCDEEEPEFEIVTHSVLHSYFEDRRSSSLLSSGASGFASGSGSSVRRSMTPSVASAYSTSSAGRDSISSVVSSRGPAPAPTPTPAPLAPVQPLRISPPYNALPPPSPAPSTPLPIPVPGEIMLKAVCPVGDSIVLCRIARNTPLEAVRRLLATKFEQAAGVDLDLLEHGFVLGYLSQLNIAGGGGSGSGRPGTAGGRPGTAGTMTGSGAGNARTRANSGRPGTAPTSGRTRSSSLSSMAACADPTHLTLIVTQRDWEGAVAKHSEKMTVRVLLA